MTIGGLYRAGAFLFAGFTLLGAYFWFRLPWAPKIDFDMIGVLWVMENSPKLFAGGWTLLAAGVTIYCWAQSKRLS